MMSGVECYLHPLKLRKETAKVKTRAPKNKNINNENGDSNEDNGISAASLNNGARKVCLFYRTSASGLGSLHWTFTNSRTNINAKDTSNTNYTRANLLNTQTSTTAPRIRSLPVEKIINMVSGLQTDVFKRAKLDKATTRKCSSFMSLKRSYDFEFPSQFFRDLFTFGLQGIINSTDDDRNAQNALIAKSRSSSGGGSKEGEKKGDKRKRGYRRRQQAMSIDIPSNNNNYINRNIGKQL